MHHLAAYSNRGAKNKGRGRTPATSQVFVVRFQTPLFFFCKTFPLLYLLSPINHKSRGDVQVRNIVRGAKGVMVKGNARCTQTMDFFLGVQTTP